ncbi:MAG: nicotinate-nucleotide adenylyltransferase [Bacillota bacterium]|nr:nicotinate-nucleotide adenylyltransferase [Bacillota bacterium]NLH87611.1 nicotinate-nucleotide adenylyltransferase [Bacillota bacterium]HAN87396.1 nicotinic acid mononucleotide adenylyltransferase [Bacillota bacterium]
MEVQRIGIMGGTFDPIHYGHLVTAEQAHYQFNLDKVVFVPSGLPPHKVGKHITSPGHRHMMTVLATTSNPHFEVSSIEVDRVGPSYTIDTVRAFRDRYGDEAGLYFITGADAILEMLEWKDSDTLLELCEFIAATRPGYALHNGRIEEIFVEKANRIHFFEVPALAISSTDIRERLRQGRPVRYLLPDIVVSYIERAELYCG